MRAHTPTAFRRLSRRQVIRRSTFRAAAAGAIGAALFHLAVWAAPRLADALTPEPTVTFTAADPQDSGFVLGEPFQTADTLIMAGGRAVATFTVEGLRVDGDLVITGDLRRGSP